MATLGESVRTWAEMIKFSHSVFALPFAVMATFMAGRFVEDTHRPYWGQLALIVVCMVAARSVAMTFNRIVDAEIDGRNPRTSGRPLPAGELGVRDAKLFLFGASAVFVGACYSFHGLYGNPWPVILAGPLLAYLCGYSYTKRFTQWSHFYLGSAVGLSPVAAWIAIHPPSVGWPAVVLTAAVMLWIAGFDLIYACQDTECDRAEGLFSVPAGLGILRALRIARCCHAAVVVLLLVLAWIAPLGWLYLVGVGIVAVLLTVENSLVRPDDLSRVNVAFFTINGVVSVALGVLAVCDVLIITPAY